MNCSKAQRLLDDLRRERLPESLAKQVRLHLADCTDCRVLQQRGDRLQRLLTLKRYEQPPKQYFDNFLTEFHRRQELEDAQPSWWEHFVPRFPASPIDSGSIWRYGFAGALASLLAIGLLGVSIGEPAHLTREQSAEVVASELASPTTIFAYRGVPETISAPLPSPAPSTASSVLVVPAAASNLADPAAPRYVLDRITMTPVSYEVASARF
jgi:hypothetical protein